MKKLQIWEEVFEFPERGKDKIPSLHTSPPRKPRAPEADHIRTMPSTERARELTMVKDGRYAGAAAPPILQFRMRLGEKMRAR